jgi:hypothetical protein
MLTAPDTIKNSADAVAEQKLDELLRDVRAKIAKPSSAAG